MAGKQLDEFKVSMPGSVVGDASVADPVGGEAAVAPGVKKGPKQPAEKLDAKGTGEGGSTEAASANKQSVAAKGSVKEQVAEVFAGEELSEEQQTRVEALFEAAVAERVGAERAALQEQFEATLTEEIQKITNTVDEYLGYCVKEWLEQNQVAIDTSLRSEIAESLLDAMKAVFEEHYISVPEEKIDAVEELSKENDELAAKLDEALNSNIALSKQLDEQVRASVVQEAAKDLTATQQEKFATLVEGVEFTSAEQFAKKLDVIKETYFSSDKKPAARIEQLMEEVNEVEQPKAEVGGQMGRYVAAIGRSVQK